MKRILLVAVALLVAGCATQHKAPIIEKWPENGNNATYYGKAA